MFSEKMQILLFIRLPDRFNRKMADEELIDYEEEEQTEIVEEKSSSKK